MELRVLVAERLPDLLKPFVETALIVLTFLVFPVSGEAFLGDLVHALGAYLYFHPLTVGPITAGLRTRCFGIA